MIERFEIRSILHKKLKRNPAVAILGPRQVGKTTLAKQIKEELHGKYFDLEVPNTKSIFAGDLELLLKESEDEFWIIDEVKELPEIFSVMRSIIDTNRRNGRFLLLGSADPKIIRSVSETLAGRISYMDLNPLHILEVGIENKNTHWLRGGFPRAYLAEDTEAFSEWMNDYIRSYIEREISILFDINLNPVVLGKLWNMLAHLNGNLLNTANLARSIGVDAKTINKYIELLEGAFLIKTLKPWFTNVKKRLVKSPKIYLADTGLLHTLLQINTFEGLLFHPSVGASWENYVFLQISHLLKYPHEIYFYRTHNGSEVDLLLVKGITPIAAIEIKNSNNPKPTKGFYNAIQDVGTEHNYIITRGDSFPDLKDRKVRSLEDFLINELPILINVNN